MVTVTPQDLNTIAHYMNKFDVVNFERCDQCGYKIVSRHNLGLLALNGLSEKCCLVKNLEYVAKDNMLDRLFYSFDLKTDTHQFVINPKVHKKLLSDQNEEMRDAAHTLLSAISGLSLKDRNAKERDEYLRTVQA